MKKFDENGRSMVEMLGVLAIIGVLSAGGLAGYSKAMFKHKLNTTMDQITMLATNIRTMYGTQGNYDGLSSDGIKLGIVPSVMGTAMNALTNPFKGSVSITEVDYGITDGGFTIAYTGLPQEACINLASADFGSGAGSGFVGVNVSTTASTTTEAGGDDGGDAGDDDAGDDDDTPAASASSTGSCGSIIDCGSRKEGEVYSVSSAANVCGSGSTNTVTWLFY